MDKKKENIARFGIATKGFVYVLIGGLTLMATFGGKNTKSSSSDALSYLSGSTIGMVLLAITAAGLVAYVLWRFYQAFVDPEDKGSDAKGIARRIGYFSSGTFYAFLAFTAIQVMLGSGGGSGGGKESLIASLLNQSKGQILVALVATVFLSKALYQMFRAYSDKYQKKVKDQKLPDKAQKTVLLFGKLGYTARGIVIGVIAFLTYKAAFFSDSDKAGGTKEAFSFLQNEFGTIILAVVSLGLMMYGVFLVVKARHRDMTMT